MPEEPKITMSEFKTVMESIRTDFKGFSESLAAMDTKINAGFQRMDEQFTSVREQIALLHEGQTEIKNELKQKVDRQEFSNLEKRVARLESKVA